MNDQLKAYFAQIGAKGGATTSEAKVAAVRANGAKGGRPRKDGLPPGARLLEAADQWIDEAPGLAPQARLDLRAWARAEARWTPLGVPYIPREPLARLASLLGRETGPA